MNLENTVKKPVTYTWFHLSEMSRQGHSIEIESPLVATLDWSWCPGSTLPPSLIACEGEESGGGWNGLRTHWFIFF